MQILLSAAHAIKAGGTTFSLVPRSRFEAELQQLREKVQELESFSVRTRCSPNS